MSSSEKSQVALISLLTSVVLTGAKLGIGLWIGSLALIGDSLHSGTDFLATGVTLFAVRASAKPADENHPYGHGKYESLAALGEAMLLLLLSGGLIMQALRAFQESAPPPLVGPLVVGVMIIEIVANGWRARELTRVARETGSSALAADALHFASDMASSFAVLIGLGFAAYGFTWADPLAAAAVAVLIAVLALRLVIHSVHELTDGVPNGLVSLVQRTVADIPGVVKVTSVKLRKVGNTHFIEVVVEVPRTLALERVPEIKEKIRQAILSDLPDAEITVTADPTAVTEETVRDRIHLAAARTHLPVHHVTIQTLQNRISIGLDLEVPGKMPMSQAHEEASRLEKAIRDELGAEVEVETHLEPLHQDLDAGANVDADRFRLIFQDLRAAAPDCDVQDVHNVRVRETREGLFVTFHCRVPPSLPVAEAHGRLDRLEHMLRNKWPNLARIVSHPEPVRV